MYFFTAVSENSIFACAIDSNFIIYTVITAIFRVVYIQNGRLSVEMMDDDDVDCNEVNPVHPDVNRYL